MRGVIGRRLFPPRIFLFSRDSISLHIRFGRVILNASIHLLRLGHGTRFVRQGMPVHEVVMLLRRHAAQGHDLDGPNSPPTGVDASKAGPGRPPGFSTAFLRTATFGRAATHQTATAPEAQGASTELGSQSGEESNTGIDAMLGRINTELVFVLNDVTGHLKGTTRGPDTC
jgi:hypothetical protein